MRLEVDYKAGTPVHAQLVAQIKAAIAAQDLRPGEMLPAIAQVSEELRISRNTVARAYEELESSGLIELTPGKGYTLKEHHRQLQKAITRTDAAPTDARRQRRRKLADARAFRGRLALAAAYFLAVVALTYLIRFAGVPGSVAFFTVVTALLATLLLPAFTAADRALEDRLAPRRLQIPQALQKIRALRGSSADFDSFMSAVVEVSRAILPAKITWVHERGEVLTLVHMFPALRSTREPIAAAGDLLMPMYSQDEVLGVLRASYPPSIDGHDTEDEAFLTGLAEQVNIAADQLRIRRDKAESQYGFDIQRALLPKHIPELPGLTIAGAWQPAKTVGGDYYDVLRLDDDRIAFIVADVSGKGMPAALLMSNVQATTKAYAFLVESPAELCTRVNRAICANITPGRFVTFFYAVLDRRTLELTYCNAGHNPPFVWAPSRMEKLEAGGPVLGIFESANYAQDSVQLQLGDRVVLFTDGIVEAETSDGDDFGESRLLETIARSGHSASELRDAIMESVTQFCRGDFSDDATLLTLAIASAKPASTRS